MPIIKRIDLNLNYFSGFAFEVSAVFRFRRNANRSNRYRPPTAHLPPPCISCFPVHHTGYKKTFRSRRADWLDKPSAAQMHNPVTSPQGVIVVPVDEKPVPFHIRNFQINVEAKLFAIQWNLDLTKSLGTGRICSLNGGFVISKTSI